MSIINDLWSLHLGIMGILVSVMTLLYASLSSKVEEYGSIKEAKEYWQMNRRTSLDNSIKALRKMNKRVARLLLASFVLFVLVSAIKYLKERETTQWMTTIVGLLSLLLLVACIICAYQIYSQYQQKNN